MSRSVAATVVLSLAVVWPTPARAADPPAAGKQYALLVGCTEYENNPGIPELYGPANDVPAWAALLTDPAGFAFPKEAVTQLIGWPADPARRPTRANIAKGFAELAAKAGPGDRAVIVLSAHGAQVPIPDGQDPLDPKNYEPDGLDEIFLPADVKAGPTGLENVIRDDEIGRWLDAIRDKGAHVLIVFDCCHSGTMTRGADVERTRTVRPQVLGVTDRKLREATDRAEAARKKAAAEGRDPSAPAAALRPAGAAKGRGSLVAFYAAQPFEEAPELPLPEGRPPVRENYYGMLSFTLIQALRQRQSGLTYGELERLVSAAYRSARATRGPTPFAEGDLTREVLGLTTWPNRPAVYLRRDKKGELKVDAGALHGLTKGSVLAVRRLGGGDSVLGHVRVAAVRPSDATVTPAEFDGKPALPATALAEADVARCEVVRKDLGDLQVKVFTDSPAAAAALAALPDEPKGMVKRVGGESEAEWVLRAVTPQQAAGEYGLRGLTGDQVLLVQGNGRAENPNDTPPASAKGVGPSFRKVFGRYPAGDAAALAGGLARDLPKVFTWQNVWRVANGVSTADGGETHGLKLEVVKLKDEDARDGEILRGGRLTNGQEMLFRAKNDGPQDLWVSAFYLDANLGIKVVYSAGVGRGKTVKLAQGTMTVKGESAGREGVVVFAVPQTAFREPPNFAVIEQERLAVADRSKGAAGERGADTPFGRLLAGAAVNKGRTRDFEPKVSTTPAILSQSWVLVP